MPSSDCQLLWSPPTHEATSHAVQGQPSAYGQLEFIASFVSDDTSAAPRSTSCNGMSACGPGRHSAGSDDTCSDATCSSGDAGARRTSLAGMNQTNKGTSDRPSSP